MEYQLSPNQWLQLPMAVRAELKQIFNIPRSKGTILEGNVVKSDGHTFEDLAAITVEGMREFTGLDSTDFMTLFNETVLQVEDSLAPSLPEEEDVDPTPYLVKEWEATLLRMSSQAIENDLEQELSKMVHNMFYAPTTEQLTKTPNVKNKNSSRKGAKKAK